MNYTGSCRCGKIKSAVDGELKEAIACNCSICSRSGSLLWFVPRGWFFLQGLPKPILGFLFGVGAGGMLYLTVTDLVPEAEEHHYQQSSAIGAGFIIIFVLSSLL